MKASQLRKCARPGEYRVIISFIFFFLSIIYTRNHRYRDAALIIEHVGEAKIKSLFVQFPIKRTLVRPTMLAACLFIVASVYCVPIRMFYFA